VQLPLPVNCQRLIAIARYWSSIDGQRTATPPINLYFVWEWWEEHFQRAEGRPEHIDLDWLDATYLARQRFLYERFGEFGLGQADPVLDAAFVARVMPFHTALLPVAMGMRVRVKQVGGYMWEPLPVESLQKLRPVDLAASPLGDLLLREKDQALTRYGTVTQAVDVGSPANNAFMLRGAEFYADLIADRDLAQRYLDPITETICLAYRFLTEHFGPMEGFPLGNCNVVMMSPAVYIDMIRDYDIRCISYAAELNEQPPLTDVHHCDVRTEPFAEAYAGLPGIRSLQGSYHSNIARIRSVLPGVSFSAMLSPVDLMNLPAAVIDQEIDRCLAEGVRDFVIWNIDPRCGPDQTTDLLRRLTRLAARHNREAVISAIPFSWEEMDWEFPRYRDDFQLPPGV